MERIIEKLKNKGGKVIRRKGETPNNLIIGEEHSGRIVITPEEFFQIVVEEIKPKNIFCEGVKKGLEMDLPSFKRLKINKYQIPEDDSFDSLIWSTFFDIDAGLSGYGITKFFYKMPETKFIGIDLPDIKHTFYRLWNLEINVSNKLDDYLSKRLHLGGHNLTDKQYENYEKLRNFLYKIKSSPPATIEDLVLYTQKIRKKIPIGLLKRSGANIFLSKLKENINYVINKREETMGETIAQYNSEDKNNLTILGSYHLREHSNIYEVLDRKKVKYVSIDISIK